MEEEKIETSEKEERKSKRFLILGNIFKIIGIIATFIVIGSKLFIDYYDYELHPMSDKPIIYLYPEEDMDVSVKLGNKDTITCSYPKYEDGWNVKAKPNGDLTDNETGRSLYSLYYECENDYEYKMRDEGFVIKGEDTANFLEEKLEVLGLNEKEAEEFIVYWLPKLEENKYNYIRFASKEEIEENMPLEITPAPDTVIRVLMTYKPLEKPIEVEEQVLEKVERNGYSAVEWGGSEIN